VSLLILPLCFFLAALLIGRWWVPLAAVAMWIGIAIFLVLNDGWHGAGWGDFGIHWNIVVATLTLAGSVIGVLTNRLREPFRPNT
jgi:hypothetical protein